MAGEFSSRPDRFGCGLVASVVFAGLVAVAAAVLLPIAAQPGWQQGLQSFSSTQQPSPSAAHGTWSGTLTYRTNTSSSESAGGNRSETTGGYEATVRLWSTEGESPTWTLAGEAKIVSYYTTLFSSHTVTELGPCDTLYTDDARAEKSVPIEGGLELSDGFYNLSVQVPGIEGLLHAIRDDSGCAGSKLDEMNPYPVGPMSLGGSGETSNPNSISFSHTEPILNADGSEAGKTTQTWGLTFNP